MIKDTLNLSYPEVFELYDKVIDWEYVRNKDIYEQINAEFIPYEQNKELQQLTEGVIRQSNEELRNITRSMGFYVDYGNGKRVITPLAEIYQNYLDQAISGVVYGTFDYNTMIRKVVTQLTNSGLRYVDYASGWHNRIDVAARRAVMTGVSQLTGKISDMNAEKLGTEHFEVAWHGGARPEHAKWQGRVWSKEQLVTVCGLGTGPGLLGWNCYHSYHPFVKGISERNWSDEWLEEQNIKENTPKTFSGKEYTLYEAKQQQRKMETAMRAQREKVVLLKDGGADPDEVMLARAKYQGQLDEYGRFCKKMGLPQERERIYYDMRGRIATNTKEQNAKYTSEMLKNAEKDSKQYYRYKNIIGADIGSLADFRQMKYNESEELDLLTDYKNSVENGMISPLSGFTNYKKIYENINKSVVGITTSEETKITGLSKHFMERVIGTMSDPKTGDPRSGVTVDGIKEALESPLKVLQVKTDKKGNVSQKYVGQNGTITVNPITGLLIQCNPTDSDYIRRIENEKIQTQKRTN